LCGLGAGYTLYNMNPNRDGEDIIDAVIEHES
jgi:hypothetical protein